MYHTGMLTTLSHRTSGRYAWFVTVLLLIVWLLNYLDRQVIFSLFPLLQSGLQLSSFQLGLIGTAFLWAYSLTSPLAGHLADRLGAKPLICFSLLVWSAITWLTGHVQSFHQLIVYRCLMGVSEACYLPAGLALIAALHSPRTRSRAVSLHYSGTYIGTVLGGWLGGWGAAHYGWRAVFMVFGVVGCIYAVVLLTVLRPTDPTERVKGEPRANLFEAVPILLRAPGFGKMLAIFAAASICDWAIYAWMPLYLYEHFHLSLAQAGLNATIYIKAGGFLGLLLGGLLADRGSLFSGKARVWTQAVGLLIASPFLVMSGITSKAALLYIAMALFGLGKGMYDGNNMPVLCERVPTHLRATAFGLLNCIGTLSGGIIAAVAGRVKDSLGLGGVFAGCGALLLLAGILTITISSNGLQPEEQAA
jgi:MFS family permease